MTSYTGYSTSAFGKAGSDWTGAAKVAALIGVGVVGYFVYRHVSSATKTIRGVRRAFSNLAAGEERQSP